MKRLEVADNLNSPVNYQQYSFGDKVILNRQDQLLISQGGSGVRALDVYLSLFSHPTVLSSWNKIANAICSREVKVTPVSNSKADLRIADFVRGSIKKLGMSGELSSVGGFDALTRAMCGSLIIGMAPIEFVWTDAKTISYFKQRDARRFKLQQDSRTGKLQMRLLTRTNGLEGVLLPPRKISLMRYWVIPTDDDYGQGLGRPLYYAVEWHKKLMSIYLLLIDKAAQPSTIGKYTSEVQDFDKLIEDFKRAVESFGMDASIVLPPGFSIDTVPISLAGAATIQKLLDSLDEYIRLLITGEATVGSPGGSGGTDEISASQLQMNAKALSDAICEELNATYVRWLVDANFGKAAACPEISRNFERQVAATNIEDISDIKELVEVLDTLNRMGVKADKAWLEKRLGIPLQKPKPEAAEADDELSIPV